MKPTLGATRLAPSVFNETTPLVKVIDRRTARRRPKNTPERSSRTDFEGFCEAFEEIESVGQGKEGMNSES